MSTLPSGLDGNIDDDEHLVRFITQSNQFNSKIPKPSLFLPNKNDRETSVFRHDPEPVDKLWSIGKMAANEREIHGAAIITARSVRATGLTVEADEPPPCHAAIRNWPWNDVDLELQKAQQKELALLISRDAKLLLR